MNHKKYAIVTGAASGIGKAVADLLHKQGIVVFGLDINKTNQEYKSFICDVSDEGQIKKVIDVISEETKYLDYLVNVAGMLVIGKPLLIKDMPIKQWDAIMRVNVRSAAILTRQSYRLLKNAKNASIVNVSSEQSYNPNVGFAPYAASKAALNMLTICTAKEFLNDHIRVNAVALGTVKTNILSSMYPSKTQQETLFEHKNSSIPYGVMSSGDAAELILFLLSDKSKFVTGEILRADGGAFLGYE